MSPKYGFSQYPVSREKLDATLSIMKEHKLSIIRLSSTPPWKDQSGNGLKLDLIDAALAEGITVIIDPIHLYPPNSTTAADAKAHRLNIINCFLKLALKYGGNEKAWFELVNEYQNPTDFYPFVQGIITELRDAGVVNSFVVNMPPRLAPPYKVLKDPLDKTRQGFHPYMDYWTPTSVTNEIDKALAILPNLVLTEFGASTKEGLGFTDALVAEVNQVMELNKDKPVDYYLWLNQGYEPNWPEYVAHGIKFPAPPPVVPTYRVYLENKGTGNLAVNDGVLLPTECLEMPVVDVAIRPAS